MVTQRGICSNDGPSSRPILSVASLLGDPSPAPFGRSLLPFWSPTDGRVRSLGTCPTDPARPLSCTIRMFSAISRVVLAPSSVSMGSVEDSLNDAGKERIPVGFPPAKHSLGCRVRSYTRFRVLSQSKASRIGYCYPVLTVYLRFPPVSHSAMVTARFVRHYDGSLPIL